MENNEIIIKFGGDGNINVETLTEFLELYKDLIYLINVQLGHNEDDLIIEVSPPENGSFKIKISPKYKKQLLKSLEVIVTGTLSGLLIYYITTESSEKSPENVKSILTKSEIIDPEIHKNVYNIYQNTGAEQTIHQTFVVVNKDENITDLRISNNDEEIVSIGKQKLAQIANRQSEEVSLVEEKPTQDILTDEAILVVKTIHFEGQAKWVFVFRGYPIKAIIKDPKFIERLGDEAFRKGDKLKVILSRKRFYDEDLQTFIVDQNSYVVDEVLQHISKLNSQNKMKLE